MNESAVAEIGALYESILDRWNHRDATGMAALFAPEALVVGFDGSEMIGPLEVETTLADIFRHHQTAPYVHKIRSVRLLGPDVAVVRAVVGMVPPGQSDLNPAANAVQTLVASRRDGRWRGEVFQNTPAAFHGRPDAVTLLTEELSAVWRNEPQR